MSSEPHPPFARLSPVDSQHSAGIFSTRSLLCNFAVTQLLGFLYGLGCCVLPMIAALLLGSAWDASFNLCVCLGAFLSLAVAMLALLGLNCFGFPVLLLERRICKRFLRSVDLHAEPVVSPFDPGTRVVELVPRDRWRKRLCLDTATDLMIIRVDPQGVWMKGDRFRYELPVESIVAASLESFRPPCCSFQLHMVILCVRTADGMVELPICYRDYSWGDMIGSRRRQQAVDLAESIHGIAKGHRYRSPPTVSDQSRYRLDRQSNNPYAAPALIHEPVTASSVG